MLASKLKLALTTIVSFFMLSVTASECSPPNINEFTALLKTIADADKFNSRKDRTSEALSQISVGAFPGQADWHLLASLRKEHPRIIILKNEVATINDTITKDPVAEKLYKVLKARAEEMLMTPATHYSSSLEGALTESRLALKHLTAFAAMYRLTGDIRYFNQARAEMLNIAEFPDWGPENFLDVAEMTASMAIGYDWFFDQLSTTDRQKIRQAIVTRGLDPGLAQYHRDGWWRVGNSNWNFVCNGGLALGALAIAEDEPVKAERVIACAAVSTPIALQSFSPDGGWSEGPMYWTYGTRYLTYFLSGLQSALGTDFGFSESKGLSETGSFRIYTQSPTGKCFNFADSETEVGRGAQMFWLSRKFKQPVFAGAELKVADIFPEMFHLLFYTPNHTEPAQANLPLNRLFKGVDVACLRSSWTDPNAAFVGFKGGDNKSHHAHLDLGSFIFDCNRLRWAEDLGPGDYALPGYFSDKRWQYYRTRTESHNTLTIDSENQNIKAAAKIVRFSADELRPFAIADITKAYESTFKKVSRGVKLLGKNGLLIQDEIESPNSIPIKWHFHTRARVQLSKSRKQAVLLQPTKHGTAKMFARILSPSDAVFSTQSDKTSALDVKDFGTTDLSIPFRVPEGHTTIMVQITRNKTEIIKRQSLKEWQ